MTENNSNEKLPVEMWVDRKKANILTLGLKGDVSVTFYPGKNQVKDPKVIKLLHDKKCNTAWLGQLNGEAMVVLSGKPAEVPTSSDTDVVSDMTVPQVIQQIEGVLSIAALEKMYSDEQSSKSRKTVLEAIEKRIKALKES